MKNIYVRTISGLVFILIMVTSILWGAISYIAVVSCIIAIMLHEYLKISVPSGMHMEKLLAIMSGMLLFMTSAVSMQYRMDFRFILPVIIPIIMIPVSLLSGKEKEGYRGYAFMLASIIYIALPFSLLNMSVFDMFGRYDGKLLLSMFIVLWVSDIGAYCFGMMFGQKNGHKMCPSISPKKSWEGFFGGLLSALVTGYILSETGMFRFGIFHSIALAAVISLFGVLGDLVESQFKRNFGVKDSGSIMPGHGGLLDRFDGALIAFPMAVIYIELIIR